MNLMSRVNRLWANTQQPHIVPGWLEILEAPGGTVYVRWLASLPDTTDPQRRMQLQHGRLWLIQPEQSDAQILNTFLLAMLTFVEHEIREDFRFNGTRPYHPTH